MSKRLASTVLLLTFVAAGTCAAADLHDPTRPDNAVVPESSAPVTHFVVSAIFVSDNRRVAIVNGKTVTAGDRIGGALVRAINAHTVELRYGDKTIQARLNLARVRE